MHIAYPQSDFDQRYYPENNWRATDFQSIKNHIEFDCILTANEMVDPTSVGKRSKDHRRCYQQQDTQNIGFLGCGKRRRTFPREDIV